MDVSDDRGPGPCCDDPGDAQGSLNKLPPEL